ncbi:hypothetical protein [Legionella brunensis]|uniref:Uncharacterized protein n=1 Tax=Legionella brunensis TaxID=29422 RepID=A0A0W0SUN6_9GAMM|nr:hypothetical protein [Legionella brunensis]KTC87087.1 hypothetical protein Lbru_0316 [Legionella brunensis]
MAKPTPNIDAARQYIFNCHAFGNYSFYPDGYGSLNSHSVKILKKNNWRSNWHDTKPTLEIEQLVNEGMSQQHAELCLFLIENRKLFDRATAFGDGRVWENNAASKWESGNFIDRYYVLAEWTFGETAYQTATIKTAVKELRQMREAHLPAQYEEYQYYGPNIPYNFEQTLENLDNLISKIKPYEELKAHFKDNKKITDVINRLEQGANSYNPYWINSSKKLDRIMSCLSKSIDKGENINALLSDKESELSKAIDMKRITGLFFEPKEKQTKSREIINHLPQI